MKLEFSRRIFKKYSISNIMKIRRVGTDLFHVEGRTEDDAILRRHLKKQTACRVSTFEPPNFKSLVNCRRDEFKITHF